MIDRRDLVRVLARRNIADWVVIERDQELAVVDEAAPRVERTERRTLWQLTIHDDTAGGRGTAHLEIDATNAGGVGDTSADEIVDQALALARAAVGRAWTSTPPAAPAQVELRDPALIGREPIDAARAILAGIARPAGTTAIAKTSVLRETVAAADRQGLHIEWQATLLRADALVIANAQSLCISREVRRASDFDLDAAIIDATRDLELLANAGSPPLGPCALVLRADAMLHADLGVWAAFANQADAVVERRGLTRYRERAPIAPDADRIAEPLTVMSDGALAFGVRSAPIGDTGEAIRQFALVDHGIAAGLGLSPREAALRGRDPNGGVRNLIVTTGTWSPSAASDAHVIELRRLRDLTIDPYTGDARLEIGLAIDHATGKAFAGGSVRIDLIVALALARRSATRIRRGAYEGPDAILIDHAELLA